MSFGVSARHLTLESAAERLGWGKERLEGLETGQQQPSLGDLETIAQRYQTAFATHQFPAMVGVYAARRNRADPYVVAMAVQSRSNGEEWAVFFFAMRR